MNDLVIVKRDKVFCDSLMVADRFGKPHYEILKTIEGENRGDKHINGLIDNLFECDSRVNTRQYFILDSYKDSSGRTNKMYLLSRDGFTLLVMGFTGRDALDWKLKYLGAFNQMERLLMERQTSEWQALRAQSKDVRKIETDSVKDFVEYAMNQGSENAWRYYSNLTKLVNKAAGITTRNLATGTQLNSVMFLDRMIGGVLRQGMAQGMEYKDIYDLCKGKVLAIKELALLDVAA